MKQTASNNAFLRSVKHSVNTKFYQRLSGLVNAGFEDYAKYISNPCEVLEVSSGYSGRRFAITAAQYKGEVPMPEETARIYAPVI